MKIVEVSNLNLKCIFEDIEIALGYFDGLHKGHFKLIEEFNKDKKKALLTFSKSIRSFFLNEEEKVINQISDKVEILKNKVDYLIVLETNHDIINSSKEEFINFLKINNVKRVITGSDFTFGKNKEGNVSDLKDLNLTIVPDYYIDNIKVSSTYIRGRIEDGLVYNLDKFLGYNYFIKGKIIHGAYLGHTIGFPTINICPKPYITPKIGVYAGFAYIDNIKYKGMINVGYNPTFNLKEEVSVEMNLFDTNLDLYGKFVKIEFIKFIRSEVKFNSKDELILQLEEDRKSCKKILNNY